MLEELITIVLSSAGLTGSVFACILTFAVKKAKSDAQRKHEERLNLEILRLEGEEKLSALLFALIHHARSGSFEHELEAAEKAYSEYLEESRRLKNEIIGTHTSK